MSKALALMCRGLHSLIGLLYAYMRTLRLECLCRVIPAVEDELFRFDDTNLVIARLGGKMFAPSANCDNPDTNPH